jgi:hypothetical protein
VLAQRARRAKGQTLGPRVQPDGPRLHASDATA